MKQGSYRIRWENVLTKQVEEVRIDVERRNIYVSGDILSDSAYYRIDFDTEWRVSDFEVTYRDAVVFHCQRKMNGMWVDRLAKRIIEEFENFEYFDLSLTPLTHIMAIKRLDLAPGQSAVIDVALFDVPSGSYRPVQQTYTRIDDNSFLFQFEGAESTISLNSEGMISQESGRFRMLDFQIW